MAKKDLRAQMDAARAAAAFIGAAQEEAESLSEVETSSSAKETGAKEPKAKEVAVVPETEGETSFSGQVNRTAKSTQTPAAADDGAALRPKASRTRKPRKKSVEAAPAMEEAVEGSGARMTAQVLVPMTAEQREHADLLASVMKVTRAEVMRQALDEYWESHKSELQAAVAAYEELIKKLMK